MTTVLNVNSPDTSVVSTYGPDRSNAGHMGPDCGTGESAVDWGALVRKLQEDDPAAMEQLYTLSAKQIRSTLYRWMRTHDLDDKVHDVFVIVIQAIRKGNVREPERLMGFIRTVAHRQAITHVNEVVRSRKNRVSIDESCTVLPHSATTPGESAVGTDRVTLMRYVLQQLSARHHAVLTRFYLQEQSPERVCREMNLTNNQFRMLKSRAKARFAELGRRRLAMLFKKHRVRIAGRVQSGPCPARAAHWDISLILGASSLRADAVSTRVFDPTLTFPVTAPGSSVRCVE